jgi:hypothetical protein
MIAGLDSAIADEIKVLQVILTGCLPDDGSPVTYLLFECGDA